MQYLGGKSRTRNQIAAYLNQIRQPGQGYWEPFVGAGWVLEKIKGQPIWASDANPYLIAMWQRLQEGWEPPSIVTEEMYQEAKNGLYSPELTAFIGFGCSFGGKWFAGYARGNTDARMVSRALLRKANRLNSPTFYTANFLACEPPKPNCLIYCDPPYFGTSDYGATLPFNTTAFWEKVRQLSKQGHTIIVSEYQAPLDFSCVLEISTRLEMRTINGRERRVEKLFRLGEHQLVQPRLL